MAFTAGGRFNFITAQGRHLFKKNTFTVSTLPRARPQPPHSQKTLVVGSSDTCRSRDEHDGLVSSVGHRTGPILADQESPPYVTAIRVLFLKTNVYNIYLFNVRIFIQ